MKDYISTLYGALKNKGYTDIGKDETEFRNWLNQEGNVKTLYGALSQQGFDDIGDEQQFSDWVGVKKQPKSDDDAVFEANAERFRNGQPTERVTTQSMIDAHPELGLGEQTVQKPSVKEQYILDNRPDMFGEKNASLMDVPLGNAAESPELSGDKLQARIDVAQRNLQDKEYQKGRTKAQLRRLNQDVSDALGELQERVEVSQIDRFRPANLQSMPVNPVNQELMPEYTALRKAQRLAEESENIINEAGKKGNTNFMAGLARGFWDNLNAEDYTFGADDAAQSAYLYQALDKADRGEQLTKAEETLLDAAVINMATQSYFAQDLGKGYGAGSVTAESIPFMLEMAINPISASGKTSAKMLLKYGLKKFANNKAAKVGARLLGDALAGAGMAATTGAGEVLEGTTDRLAKNYNYGVDLDGKLYVNKKDDAMGIGEALTRSFATRAIENQSEMIFKAFEPIGGFMKGVQDVLPGGVNKFFDMLSHNKVADAYRWLKKSPVFRNYLVKDVRNATQIGGIFEEYAEEVYNNLANFAIGEMSWDDVVSLDNNIDTFLGLAPTQVMFGLLGLGGAGAMRYQTRRTLEDLQATMNEQQRKQLEGLLDMGLDAEEVDVRSFIRNVMQNENYTINNKRDMIKAAFYVAKQKGIDQLTEADVIDKVKAENAIIDSVTDPSTGLYSEMTAKLPDAKEGTIEVPGNVVGWFGEGDKRQPIFVAEGMDNTEENRRVLKPGEWDASSVQEMPAEQVKTVNEEMIREEAVQQAENEARWNPNVPEPQEGISFFNGDEEVTIVGTDGNGGLFVAPSEEYRAAQGNEKKVAEVVNRAMQLGAIPIEQYKDAMTAQIEAEEKAAQYNKPITNEDSVVRNGKTYTVTGVDADGVQYMDETGNPNKVPTNIWKSWAYDQEQAMNTNSTPGESVSEQVNAGVNAEVNNSEASGENVSPVEAQQSLVIPTKEDGSIDFVSYGKEGSFKTLGEKYGEKMPNKVAVTAKALAKDVTKARKKLADAQQKLDDAPIGRDEKPMAARDKAQQELDAIQREADFWAEMDAEIKSAQMKRSEMLNPQAEVETSTEPMNVDEFVAQQLAAGNIVLNKDDYMRETGFGSEEANAMNGGAKELLGADGMTIQEAGERLMEMDRENGTNFFDQSDSNAGRDALISVLGSVKSRKELNQYIANNRTEQAKRDAEAVRNELEKSVMDANYSSLEDFVLQMEAAEVENPFMEDRADEIMAIFAEEAAKYEQSLNNTENEQGRTNEVAEGSDTILSEEQSDDTGGTEERSESERVGDGIVEEGESAHVGEQADEVELKQQEGETILQFAERVAKEPLRKRAKQWSDKLGVKVRIMESLGDVVNPYARRAIASGQVVTGWFEESTGEVCIYMPHINSESEVDATYIHEVVAHKGLRGLLGEKFDSFCDEVWDMMSDADRLKFMSYPGVSHLEGKEKSRAAADEYIAHLAENIDVTESAWSKFAELIKRFFKAIGIEPKMTNADIVNTIKKSYQRLLSEEDAEGNVSGEGTRFRFSNTPQEFDAVQKEAVEKKGIVMPGLNEAVVDVFGIEKQDFNGSLKQAREAAKQWAVENYQGKEFSLPDNGGSYTIGKKAINKYVDKTSIDKSDNAMVHLSALKELPNIISSSITGEIHADYKKGESGQRSAENGVGDKGLLVHRMFGAVALDGKVYRVKTTMNEYRDPMANNTPHSYEVTEIELIESSSTPSLKDDSKPVNVSNNSITATKLLNGVEKSYDKGKKLLSESEKTRFRVVYHGSAADFDKFDHSFMGTGAGSQVFGWGTYLTESDVIGRDYANVTREATDDDIKYLGDFSEYVGNDVITTAKSFLRDADYNLEKAKEIVNDYLSKNVPEHTRKGGEFLLGTNDDDWAYNLRRHLYEVEIPDAKRGNYIIYGNNVTDAAAKKVFDGIYNRLSKTEEYDNPTARKELKRELDDLKGGYGQGQSGIWKDLYGDISYYLGSDKEASLFLRSLGYVGIKYPAGTIYQGDYGGASNYVIFDENDLQIVNHTRFRMTNAEKEELRDSEETKALFDYAKKRFGRTFDLREAGYILPDGVMLDFSGRHEMKPGSDTSHLAGYRSVDHRYVLDLNYEPEDDGGEKTGFKTDMADFINRGAIRMDGNIGSINLTMKPTSKQRTILQRLIQRMDGDVWVDFGEGWNTEHSAEYSGVRPMRVLSDIDKYYDEGIKPEGTRFRVVKEAVEKIASEYNVPLELFDYYESMMNLENLTGASQALIGIKNVIRKNIPSGKLSEFIPIYKNIRKEIFKSLGDLDELRSKIEAEAVEQANLMESARKRAEEDAAKERVKAEKLAALSESDLDSEYFKALEEKKEDLAKDLINEAARRKGYIITDYKDTHSAPVSQVDRKDFTNIESLKNLQEDGFDVNVYAIANGISPQADDYFEKGKERVYMNEDKAGRESLDAIRSAISSAKEWDLSGKESHIPQIKVYRAVPKSIKGSLESEGQWVTPSRTYAQTHGEARFGEGKYRIIEQDVPVTELWWDGNDVREWGYDDGRSYVYKNVKNNKKLFDVVTRDNKNNIIPPSKRFDSRKSDIRFRFIGERGARNLDKAEESTTRLDNLSVAREMEAADKDAKAIKMATGWERGADGKWRYEVKDHFDVDAMERFTRGAYGKTFGAKVPLERVLKDDDTLLTEYPQLKETSVKFQRLGDLWGAYYPESNEIAINTNFIREEREISDRLERQKELVEQWKKPEESKKIMDMIKVLELNPEEVLKDAEENLVGIEGELEFFQNQMRERLETTIIHEVQHAIQHIEGFENGANVKGKNPIKVAKQKEQRAFMEEQLAKHKSERESLLKKKEELNEKMSSWYDSHENATAEEVSSDKDMQEWNRQYDDIEAELESADRKVSWDEKWIETINNAKTELGEEGYNKVAGEVEARNAARRSRSMTEEDMREYLASETEDVAREDQIFLQNAMEDGQTMFRISDKGRKIQNEVDKFTAKYNSKDVVVAEVSSMTDEEIEEMFGCERWEINAALNKGLAGAHDPFTDKMYIFVENTTLDEVEDTMFHENLHGLLEEFPEWVEEFYQRASDKLPKLIRKLEERGYTKEEIPEETFVRVATAGILRGDLYHIRHYLPEDKADEYVKLLNEFGYEWRQEFNSRILGIAGQQIGSTSGEERRRGTDVQEADGAEDEELQEEARRERKERLSELFNRVANEGLQGVLGNAAYDRMMMDIYSALPEDARKEVVEDAFKHYGAMDFVPAISDYINAKADGNLWDKIVTIVREALRKVGFDIDLNANEVRYLAWRSRKPLDRNNLLDVAEDIDMRYRLKVGEYNGSPADGSVLEQIKQARTEVKKNPTEAQKEAGNYKKGHITLDGYDITLENPKGGIRSGTDKNGKKWSITMNNDYGYICGTEAVDGDHIDIFLSENPTEGHVFVVDQRNQDGSFDESKVMYGFNSLEEARKAYLSNYEKGWENRIMAITEVSKDEFKRWIDSSHRKTKPFSEYKNVKSNGGGTRFKVKGKAKTKAELKEEVSDLKEEVKDLKSELKDLKKQVDSLRSGNKDEWEKKQRAIVSFIKGRLTKEAGSVLGKTRLDQLLTLVNKASTSTDLRKPLQFIEQVINDASIEHAASKMDKLIKTKLQGETNRGVAKGVVVDESTRRLFDSIRGTFKGLIATSIDSELRSVRGEILRFGKERNALPEDDLQGRAILQARQDALKQRKEELEKEQEELQRQNVNETKESLERRHDELVEAMDAHIEGNGVWTQEMQDEYDSIPLRLKLAEIRESQSQLDAILVDSLMTRRNAYKTTGAERKKLLAEADVLESNYTIAQEELIRLMNEVSSELSSIINEGKSRLATRRQALAERRRHIVTMGISAVKDKKIKDQNSILTRKEKFDKWFDNSWLKSVSDFMTAPLNSFNFMLKYIDRNHTIGEGELYKHFMKSEEGALEANNRLYDGLKAYNTAIEEKAKEIFGKDIEKVMKDSGVQHVGKVHKQYLYDSSDHKEGDMYPISISKGQAFYVWLTWRQEDGRAKLIADGWNDQSIEEIESLIGEDYMKFGEWITDDFFPNLREEKYNKTHIEMFGTSMAKREHYFPFKISSSDIQEKGEMGESYEGMPSTITGNIIKRTINKSRINTEQNAFDLLYKYGNDMETWNAMAKLRQDLNFLHASKAFRNYLEANSKGLFDKFMKSAEVAVKAYNNSGESNAINDFLVKINRMWAGSNIGFRLNTAMKQILSYPAFMAYSANPKYLGNLAKFMMNWKGNYDWAKENLPAFRQRIETGDLGMTGMSDPQFDLGKHIKKFTDAGMIPNQLVDALTCAAGARSVYEFEYDKAIKNGLTEEEAKNIAQYNAEVAFNETQQSSREEFVSPIQMSRNVLIKSMMNYQNSNVGYQRLGNEGLLEIMRAKHVYEQDIKNGMSKDEAQAKLRKSIVRGSRKMMVAFTILPGLWYLGSQGIVGITSPIISSLFGGGGDDEPYLDEEAKTELLWSMALGTVAGTTLGQTIASIAQGREYNPMVWMNEMQKDIKDAVKNGWNLNTTKNIALRLAKFGGVNVETWENIYLGVEHAIRTGNPDLVDFMMLINLPASQRKAMAEELYSNMPFMEYAEKVARAHKLYDDYRKNLPYAKSDKNGSKKNAIKKQYVIENLSEEKQEDYEKGKEYKKLKREYGQAENKDEWLEEHPEYKELEKEYKSQTVTKEVNREVKKLK